MRVVPHGHSAIDMKKSPRSTAPSGELDDTHRWLTFWPPVSYLLEQRVLVCSAQRASSNSLYVIRVCAPRGGRVNASAGVKALSTQIPCPCGSNRVRLGR